MKIAPTILYLLRTLLTVFLIIGTLGLLGWGYLAYLDYSFEKRQRPVTVAANAGENAGDRKWQLGNARKIEGVGYFMVPLMAERKTMMGSGSISSEYWRNSRNFLFISMRDNSRHWLYPHNNYLITEQKFLHQGRDSGKSTAIASYFEVIKSDTDANGELAAGDKITIALTKPNGQNYREVIGDADALLGSEVNDDSMLFVIYEISGLAYIAKISLESFQLLENSALPLVGER